MSSRRSSLQVLRDYWLVLLGVLRRVSNKLDQWLTVKISGVPVHFKSIVLYNAALTLLILLFTQNLLYVVIFLLILSLSYKNVLIHEFGHVLCARRYGYETDKVVLHIFGGAAYIKLPKVSPIQHLMIALAGPATNLIQLLIGAPILFYFGVLAKPVSLLSKVLLAILFFDVVHNFIMLTFNMLPLYPSDGGRVLRSLLEMSRLPSLLSLQISVGTTIILGSTITALLYVAVNPLYAIFMGIGVLFLTLNGLREVATTMEEKEQI